MKIYAQFIVLSVFVFGCKQGNHTPEVANENEVTVTEAAPSSTAEKIAEASGYGQWNEVSEINFTFNVDRAGKHFERSWTWQPKTNEITMVSEKDSVAYNRNAMDSLQQKTDAAFINDKYWLLAPFQLVWDKTLNVSEKEQAVAPISKDTLNQLTIVYGNEGGYTPGDAYDFFYDKNYKIKEWNYRKGNAEKPTMTTTWEDYKNFNGIDIATKHQDSTGQFKLYFTNISIKKTQ
jgi:hypothetical protein